MECLVRRAPAWDAPGTLLLTPPLCYGHPFQRHRALQPGRPLRAGLGGRRALQPARSLRAGLEGRPVLAIQPHLGVLLENLPEIVCRLQALLERFADALSCIGSCFISDQTLERLPTASRVGKVIVGGIDLNKPRMRGSPKRLLPCPPLPTASPLPISRHASVCSASRHPHNMVPRYAPARGFSFSMQSHDATAAHDARSESRSLLSSHALDERGLYALRRKSEGSTWSRNCFGVSAASFPCRRLTVTTRAHCCTRHPAPMD
jgi:hypothetical protein